MQGRRVQVEGAGREGVQGGRVQAGRVQVGGAGQVGRVQAGGAGKGVQGGGCR